jgi:hypothetical protein
LKEDARQAGLKIVMNGCVYGKPVATIIIQSLRVKTAKLNSEVKKYKLFESRVLIQERLLSSFCF